MRIVFIGAVLFSDRVLAHLIAMKAEVVGVCTLEFSANADHRDLMPRANQAGIPVCYAPDINSPETLAWVAARKPDVIFCFGWSRLIKRQLLDVAPMGVVGFHPAALPMNRGRHPLIWALVLGLTETASTFFFMDEGADSGDILSQESVSIAATDTAGSLYDRVSTTALAQISDFLPKLASGTYLRRPQGSSNANNWRKRGPSDGQIDWRMPATGIYNLVRGLTRPYVGAHFVHHGTEVKLWSCSVTTDCRPNLEPGKVVDLDGGFPVVKAGTDAVRLLECHPRREFSVGEYL